MTSRHIGKNVILGSCAFLAAAGLATARQAHAADIPGSSKTKATLKVESANPAYTKGVFEKAGDSDWYRVSLTKGKHYFVVGNGNAGDEFGVRTSIRDGSGKVLETQDDSPDEVVGFEFLAPSTGTFYVDYRLIGGLTTPLPSYGARVSTDCARGLATTCVQKVGQTRKSLLGASNDTDWFKATLSKGKAYTVKATALDNCDSGFAVGIADAKGKLLVRDYGDSNPAQITAFRPPRNGTYFLIVETGDECSLPYSLSLKTP